MGVSGACLPPPHRAQHSQPPLPPPLHSLQQKNLFLPSFFSLLRGNVDYASSLLFVWFEKPLLRIGMVFQLVRKHKDGCSSVHVFLSFSPSFFGQSHFSYYRKWHHIWGMPLFFFLAFLPPFPLALCPAPSSTREVRSCTGASIVSRKSLPPCPTARKVY